jgi:hypothetical protein
MRKPTRMKVKVCSTPSIVPPRYVIDDSAELTLSKPWWDDLGRPEVLYVELKHDDEAL